MLCIRQNRPAREREQRESNQPSPPRLPFFSDSSPADVARTDDRVAEWLPLRVPGQANEERQCLFVYSVHDTRVSSGNYRRPQLDETPHACRYSKICWTSMPLRRIVILWFRISLYSLFRSILEIDCSYLSCKIWNFGRKYEACLISIYLRIWKIVEISNREKLRYRIYSFVPRKLTTRLFMLKKPRDPNSRTNFIPIHENLSPLRCNAK